MKLTDLKIGTHLKAGFAILLIFVITLGAVSYFQTEEIHKQTEIMYAHPLQVRAAIGEMRSCAVNMRMNIRDFLLIEDQKTRQNILNEIAINKTCVLERIDILRTAYLGPKKDIDAFSTEFTKWVAIRDESIRIVATGRLDEAKLRHQPGGIAPSQAEKVFSALEKMSEFARNKGDELYFNSKKLNNTLSRQLFFLVGIIFFLSLFLMLVISHNIQKPLNIIIEATQRFSNGDMNARSLYKLKNEFGMLSESLNILAETVQEETTFREHIALLNSAVLQSVESHEFKLKVLSTFMQLTDSQIGAVYVLSDEKPEYIPAESIGMEIQNCKPFSADNFEGEFGQTLINNEIRIIKNIPDDTVFTFASVTGTFKPAEIITIPLSSGNRIVAVVSLANIKPYSLEAVKLAKDMRNTFSTGISAILANRKIKNLSENLANQNRELETQKNEMASQSAELIEQNTELEMQKKQLDEANRLKTSFLSNMSHELRTPLNSVIALSGVLNRRLKNKVAEEEYSYIDVIERNGKQLLLLINDILDLSRIEAGRENLEIRKFSPCELLREVMETIEPQAVEKKIYLRSFCDENIPDISSDYEKCRHILQNIVANAVKFTDKGGVEIAVDHHGENIRISVKDTGVGIDSAFLPYIFDEFRQADGSNSRKYGGTGLGMAIAKKYSEMLGSTITVESTLKVGSCFTLTIPANYNSQQKNIEKIDVSHKTLLSKNGYIPGKNETKNKTILLVEDTEPVIIQMEHMLSAQGYKIMTARNGAEALEQIAKKIPDAMILDLMMPEVDGFEVLKCIREKDATAHLPVIILTAKYVSKEELSFLKYNSIHQIIQKGDINKDQLLKAVGQMMFPEVKEKEFPETARVSTPISEIPTILIVEDNSDNMITIKALLDGKFTVIEAEDGISGIESAKKNKPDLILMDIALPGMNGIDALKEIRKEKALKDVPVIAVTASAMKGDMENLINYGFDSYISKPIDERKFTEKVRGALYGKK